MASYKVEGVTWELAGTGYKTITVVSNGILRPVNNALVRFVNLFGANIEPEDRLPDHVIHAGIVVYGYVYEYGKDGVKKTVATKKGDPGSCCEVRRFLSRNVLGKTSKSIGEFDRWIKKQKKGRFAAEKYCVANNHCNHFARAATDFLKVCHPFEWDEMCRFTEKYEETAKAAEIATRSSS